MNEEILKELAEVNSNLRKLREDIQKLASILERMITQQGHAAGPAFEKRS